ncbi:MAG: hypothetical protein DMD35_19940 [Gemmatimonadetes bacterium]|nr:MAG: hypothetical protein DMD35_19940 [Gemmatimonadota bacterium]
MDARRANRRDHGRGPDSGATGEVQLQGSDPRVDHPPRAHRGARTGADVGRGYGYAVGVRRGRRAADCARSTHRWLQRLVARADPVLHEGESCVCGADLEARAPGRDGKGDGVGAADRLGAHRVGRHRVHRLPLRRSGRCLRVPRLARPRSIRRRGTARLYEPGLLATRARRNDVGRRAERVSPRKKGTVVDGETLALLDVGSYDRRGAERVARTEPFDVATVSLEPGVSLVEASAGTGKTHSITQLVLRLLLARRADGEYRVRGIGSILVVTFTKAATDELITRVRAVLREATEVFAGVARRTGTNGDLFALRDEMGGRELPRLREALSSLDQLAIFTIHGFCKRVLEESALESGTPFGARFIEDDTLLIERIAQDWWRLTIYEDAALATLAVHLGWRHDAFLKDLRLWQRLPKTRLEPCVELVTAKEGLVQAVAGFARVWDRARAAAFLGERKWYTKSPLNDAAGQMEAVRAGDALAAGDLAGAARLAAWCTSAAMLDKRKGMYARPPALRDAVASEPFVQACDAIASALATVKSALRVSCLEGVHARFLEEKRRRHMLGFDDLLRHLHDALQAGGTGCHLASAIRGRYDAALIDEFQDTDPFQFPIFSIAFAGRPLFLIGDPKQAIFGFRGADLFAYLHAASHAERRYTLGQNWRSTPRMVAAVNGLFSRRENAFLYERIEFAPAVATPIRTLVDPLAMDGRGALHWWVMPPEQGETGPVQLPDGLDNNLPLYKGDATRRTEAATVREIVRPCSFGPATRRRRSRVHCVRSVCRPSSRGWTTSSTRASSPTSRRCSAPCSRRATRAACAPLWLPSCGAPAPARSTGCPRRSTRENGRRSSSASWSGGSSGCATASCAWCRACLRISKPRSGCSRTTTANVG